MAESGSKLEYEEGSSVLAGYYKELLMGSQVVKELIYFDPPPGSVLSYNNPLQTVIPRFGDPNYAELLVPKIDLIC